jgi:hypothetical protein
MNKFICALTVSVVGLTTFTAKAQDEITLELEPACPYGYYDFYPYACAPYGYYGPEWFVDGVFIGVGRWFHGPPLFHGHVDNRYDVRHGYRGPLPQRGERAEELKRVDRMEHFRGNELRDGRGAVRRGGR